MFTYEVLFLISDHLDPITKARACLVSSLWRNTLLSRKTQTVSSHFVLYLKKLPICYSFRWAVQSIPAPKPNKTRHLEVTNVLCVRASRRLSEITKLIDFINPSILKIDGKKQVFSLNVC